MEQITDEQIQACKELIALKQAYKKEAKKMQAYYELATLIINLDNLDL